MTNAPEFSDDATLDPPGSIAVIGAGPLGIEAALYGRFLGYDVTLIEAEAIGHSLACSRGEALPMLPDRCVSPLALSAIEAQRPEDPPITLPTTISEWIDQVLIPITETDLLRGRIRCPFRVDMIEHVPIADDTSADEPDGDQDSVADNLPPDFRLSLAGVDGQTDELDAEAVIVATGSSGSVPCGFSTPCDYFFRIGESDTGNTEERLRIGLQQIVRIYAGLGGRDSLDLYRPRRGP